MRSYCVGPFLSIYMIHKMKQESANAASAWRQIL